MDDLLFFKDFMFPFFDFFGKQVGTYALCSIVGLLCCGSVSAAYAKTKHIQGEDVILLTLVASCGMVIGGHLLYGFIHLPKLFELFTHDQTDFTTMFQHFVTQFSGSVFYGGLIGAIFAIHIYTRNMPPRTRGICRDLLALSIPLFHAFGRLGCFLGGCCYGIPCSWGILIENHPFIAELNGTTRFPVQLLECLCNLGIFLFLRYRFRKNRTHGTLITTYLFIYPIIRFCIEFLRGDTERGFFLWFSTSQWISMLLFTLALFQTIKHYREEKRGKS